MEITVVVSKVRGGYSVRTATGDIRKDDAVFMDGDEKSLAADILMRLLCPQDAIEEVMGSAIIQEALKGDGL